MHLDELVCLSSSLSSHGFVFLPSFCDLYSVTAVSLLSARRSVRRGLTRERSGVAASYWTRRTENGSPPVAGGDSVSPEPKRREGERVSTSLSRWHRSAVPHSAGTLKRITDSNDQHPHLLSHVPCLGIRASRCLLPYTLISLTAVGLSGQEAVRVPPVRTSPSAQQEDGFRSILPAGTGPLSHLQQ